MEFDRKTTWLIFLAVIVIGAIGMNFTPMASETIWMMVVPSMIVFGLIMVWLGIQHGEWMAQR